MPNIPTSEIIVGARMREGLGDIEALARSIEKFGLMQPVVVTPGKELIAGKRRLEAVKLLGWTKVPVRIMEIKETEITSDDLDMLPVMLRMEIEENRVRKDYVISEKVKIAQIIEPYLKKAAKKRQSDAQPGKGEKAGMRKGSGKLPEPSKRESRNKAPLQIHYEGRCNSDEYRS